VWTFKILKPAVLAVTTVFESASSIHDGPRP